MVVLLVAQIPVVGVFVLFETNTLLSTDLRSLAVVVVVVVVVVVGISIVAVVAMLSVVKVTYLCFVNKPVKLTI